MLTEFKIFKNTEMMILLKNIVSLRICLQLMNSTKIFFCFRSSKTRMEEINEIIAKSQARAQQMLSSGAYGEDALRTMNPTTAFPFMPMTGSGTFPRHLMMSPEPNSMASDDHNHSFNGSLLNGVSGYTEHLNNQSTLPLSSPREFRPIINVTKTSTP